MDFSKRNETARREVDVPPEPKAPVVVPVPPPPKSPPLVFVLPKPVLAVPPKPMVRSEDSSKRWVHHAGFNVSRSKTLPGPRHVGRGKKGGTCSVRSIILPKPTDSAEASLLVVVVVVLAEAAETSSERHGASGNGIRIRICICICIRARGCVCVCVEVARRASRAR